MNELKNRYYDMIEICQYLGVCRETIMTWIVKKNMPAYKIGRKWMFKLSDIDEWIKEEGRVI